MSKNNRTRLESIKKDILKGFKRIYWFSYTFIKYYFFTYKFRLFIKKINKFEISILLPTRERSKKFERFLNSLVLTCNDLSRIELLLLIDEDDKEINDYKNIIRKNSFSKLNIKLLIKNFSTHAKRNNYLAKLSTGNIIFPVNDDMIFVSLNWDTNIDKEFSKLNINKPYSLWIKSNIKYSYLHCDYPIINKSWYEKLGYVGSENFNFWYLDTWICDLGFRSGKFIITPNIKVDQLSANRLNQEIDQTHLRNINSDKGEKDFKIWKDTVEERKRDSKLLQ